MQYKKLLKTLSLSAFILILIFPKSAIAISESNIVVSANNSVAGLDVILTSSNISANTNMVFDVELPNSEKIEILAKSDTYGIAKGKLEGKYTKIAGNYRLSGRFSNESYGKNVTFLKISPSTLSLSKSEVLPTDYMASTNENVEISVLLFDEYRNPISSRLIKLISSDSGLVYSKDSISSDNEGKSVFYVSSDVEKPFYISFLDVNSGNVLDTRAKIAFVKSMTNYASLAMGNSSGPATILKFENIPDVIKPMDYLSFTISAYDSADELVNSFKDKVRFSVTSDNSENVTIPSDYTFTTADQGSHTFSLALLFKKNGVYKLKVTDLNEATILGEMDFTVSDGVSGLSDNTSSIVLESPLSGTYNNEIQTISGLGVAATKIKIFDNDVLLTTLITDVDGKFSYTTTPLVNGNHSVYVVSYDNTDEELDRSESVSFSIDTESPVILSEKIEPSGEIISGSDITYSISVNKILSKATVLFNENIYDMEKGTGDLYFVKFKAPAEGGTYNLGVVLTDSLQNQTKIDNKATITVVKPLEVVLPVSNLIAIPSDKKITLNWDEADEMSSPISFYRIFYGISPDELTNAVDTFTSLNTWYIPNLQNGVRYYFVIVAVSEIGTIGEELSNIASAVPILNIIDVESPDITHGVAGSDVISSMEGDVSNTGPGVNILILLTALFSFVYFKRKSILALIK